jgi:hypothetical protein
LGSIVNIVFISNLVSNVNTSLVEDELCVKIYGISGSGRYSDELKIEKICLISKARFKSL